MYIKKNSTTSAFTLAEVLITLAVIGVVAALAIPSLMTNTNNTEYKTAYKKAYAIASQALLQGVNDYSIIARTGWTDATNNTINWNAFRTKFQATKYCDGTVIPTANCWDMSGEKFNSSQAPTTSTPAFVDSSGMQWVQGNTNFGSLITGDVLVDTNGNKGPNHFGKDRFRLEFTTSDGLIATPGLPIKIQPDPDFTAFSATYCNFPPCYYTSWLLGDK